MTCTPSPRPFWSEWPTNSMLRAETGVMTRLLLAFLRGILTTPASNAKPLNRPAPVLRLSPSGTLAASGARACRRTVRDSLSPLAGEGWGEGQRRINQRKAAVGSSEVYRWRKTMTQAARFRDLLRRDGMVVAPGAYDCITARLIERAGFEAVYMTGAGTAATLGYPDFGLVTMSEMVGNAGRIAAAVALPVIADADTGYGNELNVVRTVREYETAGVAGIHIEDQGFPKKCGHLDDKEIVPREDWLAKIRAAAAARRSADFLVIARTDARAVAGFDEAIARANGAITAGADMAFVEAPQT